MEFENELLVHAIKAVGYRFEKSVRGSKEGFGTYKISTHTRSPNEIINHMFDLVQKTASMIIEGHFNCPAPEEISFSEECERFLKGLKELEKVVAQHEINLLVSKKLLQGPILDIGTHVGQIAMLNGLHGNKISKENFYSADV